MSMRMIPLFSENNLSPLSPSANLSRVQTCGLIFLRDVAAAHRLRDAHRAAAARMVGHQRRARPAKTTEAPADSVRGKNECARHPHQSAVGENRQAAADLHLHLA